MDEEKRAITKEEQTGGVNIVGANVNVSGDIIGGHKIVQPPQPSAGTRPARSSTGIAYWIERLREKLFPRK